MEESTGHYKGLGLFVGQVLAKRDDHRWVPREVHAGQVPIPKIHVDLAQYLLGLLDQCDPCSHGLDVVDRRAELGFAKCRCPFAYLVIFLDAFEKFAVHRCGFDTDRIGHGLDPRIGLKIQLDDLGTLLGEQTSKCSLGSLGPTRHTKSKLFDRPVRNRPFERCIENRCVLAIASEQLGKYQAAIARCSSDGSNLVHRPAQGHAAESADSTETWTQPASAAHARRRDDAAKGF